MTVQNNIGRTQFVATSGQTAFTASFQIESASDLVVFKRASGASPNDTTDKLVLTTNYTISTGTAPYFPTITLTSGAILGDIVTLVNEKKAQRTSTFPFGGSIKSADLNSEFDNIILIFQNLLVDIEQRSILYPYSGTTTSSDRVLPVLGANQTFVKNSANTAFIPYTLPIGGLAPISATYITLTPEASLPNELALSTLGSGFLIFNSTTPTVVSRTLTGTTNQISVTNGAGDGGNPVFSLSPNLVLPGTSGFGIPQGTTAQRVTPSSGIGLRYNTSLNFIEYFDSSVSSWVQLANSSETPILQALLASHDPTKGASLIGIQDQTGVINKTVQDLANAPLISKTNTGVLKNGQYLSDLFTGILQNTTGTGVLSINIPLTNFANADIPVHSIPYKVTSSVWGAVEAGTMGLTILAKTTADEVTSLLQVLPLSGGSMTGPLILSENPTETFQAATKFYVDSAVEMIPLSKGGTNTNLTATLGGLVYGTSTGMAFLTSTPTTGKILRGTGTNTMAWTNTSYPTDVPLNGILFGQGENQIGTISKENNYILRTDGAGMPYFSNILPALSGPNVNGIKGQNVVSYDPVNGISTDTVVLDTALTNLYNAITGTTTTNNWKTAVKARATASITISNPGTSTFDSLTITSGDRVLLLSQSTPSQNGVYVFNGSSSAMTRPTDLDSWTKIFGSVVPVSGGGTLYGNTIYANTNSTGGTLGTTSVSYAQVYDGKIALTNGQALFGVTGGNPTPGTFTGTASRVTVTFTGGNWVFTLPSLIDVDTSGQAATATFAFNAGSATSAGTAGTAGGSTNLLAGTANQVPYQSGASTTVFATAGTQYQVFRAGASGVPGFGQIDLSQSVAVTGTLPNARTTATNANTASAIVARDGSGNFSAGTITAALTGNSTSATNIAGGAINQIPYQTASSTTAFMSYTNAATASTMAYRDGSGSTNFNVASANSFTVDATYYLNITSSNPLINFDANDFLTYSRSSNVLTFNIAGVPKFNIYSAGIEAPTDGTGNNQSIFIGGGGTEGGQLVLGHVGNGTGPTQESSTWNMDVDSSNVLRFFSVSSGGVGTTAMSITPATGVITTTATIAGTIANVSSRTISTFTPNIGENANFFTSTGSGQYTQLGNIVNVFMQITWTSLASAVSGNPVSIVLPLTINAGIARTSFSIGFQIGFNVAGTSYTGVVASANSSTARILLFKTKTDGTSTQLLVSDCLTAGEIQLSGTFIV